MTLDFDKYAAKGNQFVNLVAEDLEINREKAGRIIRAVLHALRNRLTPEESFQLVAQLPMALKAIYIDGWKFGKDFKRIKSVTDFLDEVRLQDANLVSLDLEDDSFARHAIASVLKTMNAFVSEGEMNDVMDILPPQLKAFFKESLAGDDYIL
jgi:uncharacterized protein (DUF2267 family)